MLVRTPTIALVGNPNTGKTTLFNGLAGMRQRVGNYPGVTVEKKNGRMRHGEMTFDVIDLPGTYSLSPRSPDEMVAVDVILGQQQGQPRPDVVVMTVDASNLERNLYLTSQVMELGVPVVVALNMTDVAAAQGLTIDAPRLARQLGVPVVPLQAHKGVGIEQLKTAILDALQLPAPPRTLVFPMPFESEVANLRATLDGQASPFLVRRLLLDVGGFTEKRMGGLPGSELLTQVLEARRRLAGAGCAVPEIEARVRYAWIREAVAGCIQRPAKRPITWTDRLDRVLTHKIWGTAVFLAVMFIVFQAIFTWAKPLMDVITAGRDWLADAVQAGLPPGPLRSLLADGVIKGVGTVLAFVPQIAILFGFIAILEDCGYMARAAFLVDRLMARCGLNGKSFIPLLSSVACAVPGIMAARVIENRRDRLATIMVAPLMSCSARLPVYLLLIGAFFSTDQGYAWWMPGVVMFAMYAIGLVVAPLVAFCLKKSLLRGETPAFVMEMPLYKWPAWRTVFHRMTGGAWMFVRRAGTLILATTIVVWALLYFPMTHPDGGTFEERIEALESDAVKHQRQQIAVLEKPIAKQMEELEQLQRRAKLGNESARDLERRLLLESQLAPTLAAIKPLQEALEPVDAEINKLGREWSEQSILGQIGIWIEPAVKPLGWDWRIGMAAIASFPAREVMVGTLGLIYGQGKGESDDRKYRQTLGESLQAEGFTATIALSVMVFFALCCQCASTLVVIRRETNSWGWPVFTFVYMTALAYLGALAVNQVGKFLVG